VSFGIGSRAGSASAVSGIAAQARREKMEANRIEMPSVEGMEEDIRITNKSAYARSGENFF
jgi:hypothetical protein